MGNKIEYPQYICFKCGHAALKKAGKEPRDQEVTCHESECDACGKTGSVCHVRNWGRSIVFELLVEKLTDEEEKKPIGNDTANDLNI